MKRKAYKYYLSVTVGVCLILAGLKLFGAIHIAWAYVFASVWAPIVLALLLVFVSYLLLRYCNKF